MLQEKKGSRFLVVTGKDVINIYEKATQMYQKTKALSHYCRKQRILSSRVLIRAWSIQRLFSF